MICLDTNILYNYMFRTERNEEATRLLAEHAYEDYAITTTVLDELTYIVTGKLTGKTGWSLREHIMKKGYPRGALEGIKEALERLEALVIEEKVGLEEFQETIKNYRILPQRRGHSTLL